jgi:hypothetical protein
MVNCASKGWYICGYFKGERVFLLPIGYPKGSGVSSNCQEGIIVKLVCSADEFAQLFFNVIKKWGNNNIGRSLSLLIRN